MSAGLVERLQDARLRLASAADMAPAHLGIDQALDELVELAGLVVELGRVTADSVVKLRALDDALRVERSTRATVTAELRRHLDEAASLPVGLWP